MSLGKDDLAKISNVIKSGGQLDTKGMADQKAKEMVAELNRQREAANKANKR